ncbi:FkbM family methyltransferase [Amycolatopsis anabasis]|uniref:FkbM family methyltransferase n=1 Tax=Amycolatopsis anabasis TaxID=1840409 RepID=UPI00131A6F58|nr:FkbM family methyltransferase [Amycolatopsis anabasis]
MISYAQNAEDVVLARVFHGQETGRYVDIGAGYPVEDSVTKHFHDRGWRGINIEPEPTLARRLRRERPDDVNLAVAVGAKPGKTALHVVDGQWGRATLDDGLAEKYRRDWPVHEVEVDVVTLADLLDEHPGPVDFLKIDVEGAERDVIEGADWTRHRPRVVVVEATEPGSPTPAHAEWEPILTAAGYRCALFDGLNRFYAQAGDEEALARLAAPANVFDEYERYDLARLRTELRTERSAEAGYIRRLEGLLEQAHEGSAERDAYVRKVEETLAQTQRDAARARRYAAALENRVAELEAQLTQRNA